MKTPIVFSLCMILVLSAGMVGITSDESASTEKAPVVGKIAPDITTRTLDDKLFKLEDYRGHLTLVVFWATWCGPCNAEIPHLKAAHEKFEEKGLVVASISREDTETIREHADKKEMNWTLLRDIGAKAGTAYKVRYIPSMFLVAPDGRILASTTDLRGEQLESTIEEHLHLVPKETLDKIREAKEKEAA